MKTWQERLAAAGFNMHAPSMWRRGSVWVSLDSGCVISVQVREDWMAEPLAKVEYLANEGPNACLDRALRKPFGVSHLTVGEVLGIATVTPVPPVDVVDALKAAGWSVEFDEDGDCDAMRDGLYYFEPNGITAWRDKDTDTFSAVLGDDTAECPVTEGHPSAVAALSALMALPFGSTTVGVVCGVVV